MIGKMSVGSGLVVQAAFRSFSSSSAHENTVSILLGNEYSEWVSDYREKNARTVSELGDRLLAQRRVPPSQTADCGVSFVRRNGRRRLWPQPIKSDRELRKSSRMRLGRLIGSECVMAQRAFQFASIRVIRGQ